ncbi:FkbM family methyltransferase [Roseibium album]|uniref:FkbM family methyltransferase n=1 Tax=Roseibium album TaxID=311410 RepID=UPI003918B286
MTIRDLLSFQYRKKLPAEFGSGRVLVTGRSDMRVLKPGWTACAHDLMLVTRSIVEKDMCVWDIGSNLGILSAMAAGKIGPGGSVYALEADPEYARLINLTAGKLPESYAPVTVLCAAIADKRGVMTFGVADKGHARSKLLGISDDDDFKVASQKQVVTVTGDELLEYWSPPAFVKMDVEGAELLALSGSQRLLTEIRPIFYLEVSPQNQTAVSKLLKSNQYEIFHLKGDGSEQQVDECTFYTIARPG